VTQFLEGIQADLKAGRYRPSPVMRRWIPKADGKQRPLRIPTVRDLVRMAAKIVAERIFEADLQECSYGFGPKRSATQALEAICEAGNRGYHFVIDADVSKATLTTSKGGTLMELVKERIWDRRVLKLIRQWLAGRSHLAVAGEHLPE
jgi:RNA-directed DNA polymerase